MNQFDYVAPGQEKVIEKEVVLEHKEEKVKDPFGSNHDEKHKEYMLSLLKIMLEKKGSDLFITSGFPPAMKLNGALTPINDDKLSPEDTLALTHSIMNNLQWKDFSEKNDCNFAISPPGIGRFRVNAFRQQGRAGMVLRVINTKIPELEPLGVPPVLKDIIMEKRGLIIIVGATGSGKSTTLAAMLGYRNANHAGHIITIEDPIEFVHPHNKSIFTQREIGVDAENWEIALKNTLRQAPDVILIGEIRDRETMEYAVAFAETGHLCLATLHANNSNQALDRIINFFPEERRHQLLMDLSLNLKAIVSQRLIPSAKTGRAPAVEILINTPFISDLIFKGEVAQIKEAMKKGRDYGMQTFDQALFDLYEQDRISMDEALRNADSANDLRLNIKLNSKKEGSKNEEKGFVLKLGD
jgi:twitching motility protein PilU